MRKNLRRGFRRDLRPRSGRQRAQEPEALRHDPQRLRHSGGRRINISRSSAGREAASRHKLYLLRCRSDELAARREISLSRREADLSGVEWETNPAGRRGTTGLRQGLQTEFRNFIPLARRQPKQRHWQRTVHLQKLLARRRQQTETRGFTHFDRSALQEHVQAYDRHIPKRSRSSDRQDPRTDAEDVVRYDGLRIKWTRQVKAALARRRDDITFIPDSRPSCALSSFHDRAYSISTSSGMRNAISGPCSSQTQRARIGHLSLRPRSVESPLVCLMTDQHS